MRQRAALLALILPVIAAGCALTSSDDPNVLFQSERILPDSARSTAAVQPGKNSFTLNGVMLTQNDCQTLRANVDFKDNTITVVVIAFATISICGTTRGAYAYRVVSTSITPGTYQIKVVHQFGAGRPAETVLDTQVTIT